jgi:hypothetical protein
MPVKWNLKTCFKADRNLNSFIFTLANPHDFLARTFALKAERKNSAIYCAHFVGPDFRDIAVRDDCNANNHSFTDVGDSCDNDTGLDGKIVLTGSNDFTVKEIEV